MKTEQTQTRTLIRKDKWMKNMLAVGACHLYPLPYIAVLLSMIFTDGLCIQIVFANGSQKVRFPILFPPCMVCFCCTLLLIKVNSAAYQATLKKLKRAVQSKRPQMSDKRVLLLHDNARSHTAHATVNLVERWGWEILEHSPYSPDLAP